jgi:predicted RNA binding protein YcfA (HicA-like mRNA interferase family)
MGSVQFPHVSGREVVRALTRAGFTVSHVRGSHWYLRGPGGRLVPVPVHGARTVPVGTLRSILRLAGLTLQQFKTLL